MKIAAWYNSSELNRESVPFVPWNKRIIGKQVKGLYDLVTVCNERILCVRKRAVTGENREGEGA